MHTLLLSKYMYVSYNRACCFMWVRNLVFQVKDKYKIEGSGERGAERHIWIYWRKR
jgi:hypothetical protein